jgi:hypothetical protein
MNSGRKKSSGWRPWDKRRTPEQFRAMSAAAAAVTARRDCDRRRLWRLCPMRQCQRVASCGGEPLKCQARSRPAIAQNRNAAPQVANVATASPPQQAAAPVMSAAEAAAAIKASIAGLPPDPSAGEELVAWYCEGGVRYVPRSRLPKSSPDGANRSGPKWPAR